MLLEAFSKEKTGILPLVFLSQGLIYFVVQIKIVCLKTFGIFIEYAAHPTRKTATFFQDSENI